MRSFGLGVLLASACATPPPAGDLQSSRNADDWSLLRVVDAPGAQSAHFDPAGRTLILGTPNGIATLPVSGGILPQTSLSGVSAVTVAQDGAVFLSQDGPGTVQRWVDGDPELWVDGFGEGDADPVGMDVPPTAYIGTLVMQNQAVIVDRGSGGPDTVWAFSTDGALEAPVLLAEDDGQLRDAVDVAISWDRILIADTREGSPGRFFELTELNTLVQLDTEREFPDPTGIAWDPIGDCWLVADANLGRIYAMDPLTGDSTIANVMGGQYPRTQRANLDVSDDGLLMAATVTDAVRLYGRCSNPEVEQDCDEDGVVDTCQLVSDPSVDCDGNGVIDTCQTLDETSDCNEDGLLDACPTCIAMEAHVLLAASDETNAAACAAIPGVVDALTAKGITASISLWSVDGSVENCEESSVVDDFGTELPDTAPAALPPLAECTGSAIGDWGRGLAVLAHGVWTTTPIRRRVLIPIIDTSPVCGAASTDRDNALTAAVDEAIARTASIHPLAIDALANRGLVRRRHRHANRWISASGHWATVRHRPTRRHPR